MNRKEHWDSIYLAKGDQELSWTQPEPIQSLKLIGETCRSGQVLDVGGDTSILAERLSDLGYDVTVLDISETALERSRMRLGAKASHIKWITADILSSPTLGNFDVWHDRAVFHFLTTSSDREAYKDSCCNQFGWAAMP